jgi:hypothetical protein
VPLATELPVAGFIAQIPSPPIQILARIGDDLTSDRMRLGLVRAVAPNSSTKGSKNGAGGSRTHGGGFAIRLQAPNLPKKTAIPRTVQRRAQRL